MSVRTTIVCDSCSKFFAAAGGWTVHGILRHSGYVRNDDPVRDMCQACARDGEGAVPSHYSLVSLREAVRAYPEVLRVVNAALEGDHSALAICTYILEQTSALEDK